MFTHFSPIMTNEVQYRSEQFKEEVRRDLQAQQAKQGRKETRKNSFSFLTGAKKNHLSIQQG